MNVRLEMFKYCCLNMGVNYVECQLTRKFSNEMLPFHSTPFENPREVWSGVSGDFQSDEVG